MQKATWLPRLASGAALAAFGLTEPGFGSDAGGMTTRAVYNDESRGAAAVPRVRPTARRRGRGTR